MPDTVAKMRESLDALDDIVAKYPGNKTLENGRIRLLFDSLQSAVAVSQCRLDSTLWLYGHIVNDSQILVDELMKLKEEKYTAPWECVAQIQTHITEILESECGCKNSSK